MVCIPDFKLLSLEHGQRIECVSACCRARSLMEWIIAQIVIIVLLLAVLGLFAYDDRRNRQLREDEEHRD